MFTVVNVYTLIAETKYDNQVCLNALNIFAITDITKK